ncbi:MAG TPA: hypothetical protein VGQ42_06860 [Candidatus Dormibacteraeota bacterium]|nr:hypothetical protein [Candidatus Dormibacteraeota bacterium]
MEGVVARPFGRRVVRALLAVGLGAAVLAWPSTAAATKVSLSGDMEGAITVSPGDTVRAGWDLSMPGSHPAATVTVSSAGVGVSVACQDGRNQWVGIGLPGQTFSIAANDSSWHPAADSGNPAAWQGSTVAPRELCHGSAGPSRGAVMVANLTSSDSVDMVSLRFHYSDHSPGSWSAAKSVQPSSSGAPAPTSPATAAPAAAGTTTPVRGAPATPVHSSAATARGGAPATPSASASAPARQLTPATGVDASPAQTDAPRALQQSITALHRPLNDPGVSTTPPALLGLWSAGGVGIVAVALRWRWRRHTRRG